MTKTRFQTPATRLLQECRGQEITIPNLLDLCPGWEYRPSPIAADSVEAVLDEWREKWITCQRLLKDNKRANVSFLALGTLPDADLRSIITVAKWTAFVFLFDDALDYDEFKDMAAARKTYCTEAVNCVKRSMLAEDDAYQDPSIIAPVHKTACSYYEIGYEIRQKMKNENLQEWICHYISHYINSAIDLDTCNDTGEVLDVDRYLDLRSHTCAICPSLVLYVYAYNIELPRWILDHEISRRMMRLVSTIGAIDNDMYSLKKELNAGHVDNLVCIYVQQYGCSAQEAIGKVVKLIEDCYLEFQALEISLLDLVPAEHVSETKRLVKAWKECRAGLASWHYSTKRYYGDVANNAGAITVQL